MISQQHFASPNIPALDPPSRLAAGQRRDKRLAPQALIFLTSATPNPALYQPGMTTIPSASPPLLWGGVGGREQPQYQEDQE